MERPLAAPLKCGNNWEQIDGSCLPEAELRDMSDGYFSDLLTDPWLPNKNETIMDELSGAYSITMSKEWR